MTAGQKVKRAYRKRAMSDTRSLKVWALEQLAPENPSLWQDWDDNKRVKNWKEHRDARRRKRSGTFNARTGRWVFAKKPNKERRKGKGKSGKKGGG